MSCDEDNNLRGCNLIFVGIGLFHSLIALRKTCNVSDDLNSYREVTCCSRTIYDYAPRLWEIVVSRGIMYVIVIDEGKS